MLVCVCVCVPWGVLLQLLMCRSLKIRSINSETPQLYFLLLLSKLCSCVSCQNDSDSLLSLFFRLVFFLWEDIDIFYLRQKYCLPTTKKHFGAPAVIILCRFSEDFLFLETWLKYSTRLKGMDEKYRWMGSRERGRCGQSQQAATFIE